MFGAKNASMANTVANDTAKTWDDGYYQADASDWLAANDPCPAGWRLPLWDEWAGVASPIYNTYTPVPDPWHPTYVSGVYNIDEFRNLGKVGDYLFLPVVGRREGISFGRGGEGAYWSNTTISLNLTDHRSVFLQFIEGTITIDMLPKTQGLAVRCVAE
jgi:uncharacterized protein (TIGR02145 family)